MMNALKYLFALKNTGKMSTYSQVENLLVNLTGDIAE